MHFRPVHANEQEVGQFPLSVGPRAVCVAKRQLIRGEPPVQRAHRLGRVRPFQPTADGADPQQHARVQQRRADQDDRNRGSRKAPAPVTMVLSHVYLLLSEGFFIQFGR